MAVTTNNKVQISLAYTGLLETQNYTFDGVPDSEIAGLKTRIQNANQNWGSTNIGIAFIKGDADNPNNWYESNKIVAAQVTSTEEEVIYGG